LFDFLSEKDSSEKAKPEKGKAEKTDPKRSV